MSTVIHCNDEIVQYAELLHYHNTQLTGQCLIPYIFKLDILPCYSEHRIESI